MSVSLDLVMNCPKCGAQHIDHPPWDTIKHHEHLCASCGALFEALDIPIPTRGVAE